MSIDLFRREEARQLDSVDPLRFCRERFELPADVIYLDGNSLGPLPRRTQQQLADVIAVEWGNDLIRSWNDNDWITAPQRVGAKIAGLIGAKTNEVIVADSVSVNIFKLLTALARRHPERTKIVSEAGNFPTDVHVAQGAADALGLELILRERNRVLDAVDDETAALLLSHVHYRTGQRYDIAAINSAAATQGVPVVWDLSHSAGAVPLNSAEVAMQFAVGCGYKYLNGGPGAPSFLYVAEDEQDMLRPVLQGWMGHAAPFVFEDEYRPGAGLSRFLIGTPPVLSLLALEAGVDQFADVSLEQTWTKSVAMFEFFAGLVDANCPQLKQITPTDAAARGSHISFTHSQAWPVNNALIARGVIGDFRTPDVLRFGLTPLYTGFEDLSRAVEQLHTVFSREEWKDPKYSKSAAVT